MFLTDRIAVLEELGREVDKLMELAERLPDENSDLFIEVVQTVKTLREQRWRALAELGRYAVVPSDAPRKCRCGTTERHSLPAWLEKQTVDLSDLEVTDAL